MSATPQNQTDAQTSELARGRLLFRDAHDLPPLDFVLPGLLRGTVGMLVGPGGIGKSMLALAIGAAVAGRWPVAAGSGGALFDTPTQGAVAIAFGEDPALVIQHRQEAFISGLTAEQTAALDAASGLDVRSTLGVDMRLVDTSCKPYAPGPWVDELRQLCTGRRLVIVDCLSLLHDADENDNSAMAAVMRALTRVASETGCAILVLHHVGKGAGDGRADADRSRGASSITTSVRVQYDLRGPTDKEAKELGIHGENRWRWCKFATVKINYAAPIPPVWLQRGSGGLPVRADLDAAAHMVQRFDKDKRAKLKSEKEGLHSDDYWAPIGDLGRQP